MLDLDYIKDNTLWVVKNPRSRRVMTGSEKVNYKPEDDIDDVDVVWWGGQPKELQEFWKDYTYANWTLQRRDLFLIDDFYREWSKDPNQFKPERRRVIGKLRQTLDDLRISTTQRKLNVLITNYDGDTIGNHWLVNWLIAVDQLDDDIDFDVVEFSQDGKDAKIVVQTDDYDLCRQLDKLGNNAAIHTGWIDEDD